MGAAILQDAIASKHVFTTILRQLLARIRSAPRSEHQTDYQELGDASGDLTGEYQRLIANQLRRWGVPQSCATVEVRCTGKRLGREVFVAVIRLVEWERNAALRLLLGLPLLDTKIRKAVRGNWLADVSVFDGVMLQASEQIQEPAPAAELRQLVVSLTGPRATYGVRRVTAAQEPSVRI